MRAIPVAGLLLLGCDSVRSTASIDAAGAVDSGASDAVAVDAPAPDADLDPHLVFVTSTVHDCAFGGLAAAAAFFQARARVANLPGRYMAWLADANGSPATRMTHHLGVYQRMTGAVVAQRWNDLTDRTLTSKIDHTEVGVQLGGVGCNAPSPTRNFICEGGEA